MLTQLKDIFGIDFRICSEKQLQDIPLYMSAGRKIYEIQTDDFSFLVVCISKMDKFGSIALEKQLYKYQIASNMAVAYSFDVITRTQRNALIQKKIPFISLPDQIYLPFLGIAMRNHFAKSKRVPVDKMMPATQSLFLYMLYHKKNGCLKKQAAEELGLTRTSITRASDQLKHMQLISEEKIGKEIHMNTISKGIALFELAKPYLINPVQKTLYVEACENLKQLPYAGESALGLKSMLNPPKIPVVAVIKKTDLLEQLCPVDIQWEPDKKVLAVELWKYDPLVFVNEGVVDPVSLAMSLNTNEDERIEGALEEYLEAYNW